MTRFRLPLLLILSLALLVIPIAYANVGYIITSLQKEITIDANDSARYSWVVTSTFEKPVNVDFKLLKEGAEFVTLDSEKAVIDPGATFEIFFDINAPQYNGRYPVDIMAFEAQRDAEGAASSAAVGVYHTFYIIVQNGEDAPPQIIEPEPTPEPIPEPQRLGGLSLSASETDDSQCGPGTELVNGICKVLENPQDSNGGGGCLIATAAYGTELAPQVQLLREIRDSQLMQTASGASFMGAFNEVYYSFSPGIADMQRQSPVFKEAVKLFITPMLSTLSVMEHADDDASVISLGALVIGLNGAIYAGLPLVAIWKISSYKRQEPVS